ncbi:hypothetical protein [Acholeplasma hippikon]|uniref:Uncharacterized protein n=1 Tax=Acholeplasma hippikon TaxID=264636 RepID=A0A449BIA0_9MOLU|nr:hypothetical protein [Acholeplasma hippikon]VEU82184.1 Uncharacterised protein [Acholeplasma hippikon]
MAKKYQAIQTKVHWLTWTIIGVVVVSLIGLLIALQPSAKDNFYNDYLVNTQDYQFESKLPKNNKFELVNSRKGLYSLADRDNHLTIVFFGDSSNQASVGAIANVYARLFGAADADPKINPSALYEALGDAKLTLYHYSVKEASFLDLMNQLNEKYDAKINAAAMPTLVVFLDGEVVDFLQVAESSQASQLFKFYNDILDKDVVQDLLK